MHIPGCDSHELDIPEFNYDLDMAFEQAKNSSDWLYIPNHYEEYRYILGTPGSNPLVFIGINPSTAEPSKLDPTMRKALKIAQSNGFDSIIMLNVYPQRATDPNNLHEDMNDFLHDQNVEAFKFILAVLHKGGNPSICAAWGDNIEKRQYLFGCAMDIIDACGSNVKWLRCGSLTKKGHPRHPLWMSADAKLNDLDIEKYKENIDRRF